MEINRFTSYNEFWQSRKTIILIVLSVISIFVLFMGYKNIIEIQKSVSSKSVELEKQESSLKALDKLLEDNNNYSKKIAVVMKSFPESYREIAQYTERLEEIIQQNNQVLETTIDQVAIREKDGLASLKFSIKTSGGFDNYSNFISNLSTLPFHTKIDSINIDSSASNAETITVYRLYMRNDESLISTGIPQLNTNLIEKIILDLDKRSEGGE